MAKIEIDMETTQKKIIAGIDLGNSMIRVAIGKISDECIEVIGVGQSPSSCGFKFLSNPEKAATDIRSAIDEAELMAGCKVEHSVIGISNVNIRSMHSQAKLQLKEGNVRKEDYLKAIELAESIQLPPESKILHTIPLDFVIDNLTRTNLPLGVIGSTLEINAHIISIGSSYISKIIETCNLAGLGEHNIVLQALAVAETELTQDEREQGVLLIDFGAVHLKLAAFLKGHLQFHKTIGVAGNQLSCDVAVGLRTKSAEAENVKRLYGCCVESLADSRNMIEVPRFTGSGNRTTSQKALAEILGPRVEEMLYILTRDLNKAGFDNDLFAGAVITGGTSFMLGMKELAMQQFNMPVRIGSPITLNGVLDKISQPQHSTAVGLVILGAKKLAGITDY